MEERKVWTASNLKLFTKRNIERKSIETSNLSYFFEISKKGRYRPPETEMVYLK